MSQIAQTHTDAVGLIPAVARTLGAEVCAERAFDLLRRLHASDRATGFSHWSRTASIAERAMREAGLEDVEIIPVPADGRTRFEDWVMPLAWDAKDARLDLMDAGGRLIERLCSTEDEPNAIVPWSSPTPPGGPDAELILAESVEQPEQMRGKIVFTERRASALKRAAAAAGALGVASDYHPNPALDPNSTYWENVWGDAPAAWMLTERDSRIFGFCLTPEVGRRLRDRLRHVDSLRVRAVVRSRFYAGTLPIITGLLRGADPDAGEVLVSAHVFEPGAHDNASGGAAVLELARALTHLVQTERLDRPRSGVRFMLQAECYGPLAWTHLRPEQARATRAAITLDGVGKDAPLVAYRLPDCQPSFLNRLAAETLEACFPGDRRGRMQPFSLGDNLLSDPAIGIPCVWLHADGPPVHHHSSADSLALIHRPSLADATIASGAIAYFCGAASCRDLEWLTSRIAEATAEEWRKKAAELETIPKDALDDWMSHARRSLQSTLSIASSCDAPYLGTIVSAAEDRLSNEHAAIAADLAAGGRLRPPQPGDATIPSRRLAGPLTFESLPLEKALALGEPPRWWSATLAAYWWVDGVRTLGEIDRLVRSEFPGTRTDPAEALRRLARAGYVTFR